MPDINPPVQNTKYTRNFTIVVVLIVLAVVVIWVSKSMHKKEQAPVVDSQNPNQVQVVPQDAVPTTKVPVLEVTEGSVSGLPANLPVDKNPEVVQNTNTVNPDTGKHTISYVYVTNNKIDQNFTAYNKFLSQNGWKVSSTVDQPEFKALNATKGATTLSIILDYKSTAPKNQVSVDYVY